MAPDFEYFLRLSFDSRWSHTLAAIPVFTLPISLAGLWVFHTLLKRPLLRLLPATHRRLLAPCSGPFAFGPWRRFLRVVLSCLAGIGTHLLFDAFTHEEGFVVQHSPLLAMPAFHLGAYTVLICNVLQHGLTFLLLLAIVSQYRRWFEQQPAPAAFIPPWPEIRPQLPPLLGLGAVALCAALIYAHTTVPRIHDIRTLRAFSGHALLAGLSTFTVGLMVVGWWHERTVTVSVTEED
jgi:hypothetical protein